MKRFIELKCYKCKSSHNLYFDSHNDNRVICEDCIGELKEEVKQELKEEAQSVRWEEE